MFSLTFLLNHSSSLKTGFYTLIIFLSPHSLIKYLESNFRYLLPLAFRNIRYYKSILCAIELILSSYPEVEEKAHAYLKL
jgi:hypothetical protein